MAEQEPKDSLRTVLEQVKIGIKREAGNVVDENMLDSGNRSAIDAANHRLKVLQTVESLLTGGIAVADQIERTGGVEEVSQLSAGNDIPDRTVFIPRIYRPEGTTSEEPDIDVYYPGEEGLDPLGR